MPDVWVDLIGRSVVRNQVVAPPTRYLLVYGNRGNVDAFAVPLIFGVPESFGVRPRLEIAPPPQQFGKIVIPEWGFFRQEITAGDGPPLRYFMLLLPVVPAGFSGALEMEVKLSTPQDVTSLFTLYLERGDPLFDDGPKPEAIARLVQGH